MDLVEGHKLVVAVVVSDLEVVRAVACSVVGPQELDRALVELAVFEALVQSPAVQRLVILEGGDA